ncbi:carboxymuconolactone decarboxylase family protein [Thermomonospora umbrina]|uniref:AhpD family alkylhydroperoxidase n=1 Tax=Thermomonospora umbrina TaxID=111806 RepID=A0A3D9SJH0_9ACTN|nr:carboxymuconolactone decarboxylase family protein [Thermomonospora umbrina]REE95847.1 AhpD family alkylhydroperoxidase [Thermomonospora umbrina]
MSRLDLPATAREPYLALVQVAQTISEGPLDRILWQLVKLRASQLNGCVYCIDMHAHEARELGEDDDRLFQLTAWRESGLFTAAERAALDYTDTATRLGANGVTDAVWDEVTAHFEPAETGHLVMAVALINAFDRIGDPLRLTPARR